MRARKTIAISVGSAVVTVIVIVLIGFIREDGSTRSSARTFLQKLGMAINLEIRMTDHVPLVAISNGEFALMENTEWKSAFRIGVTNRYVGQKPQTISPFGAIRIYLEPTELGLLNSNITLILHIPEVDVRHQIVLPAEPLQRAGLIR
jgi:hypothetical protein